MSQYTYFVPGIVVSDLELMRTLIINQSGLAPTFEDMQANGNNVNGQEGFDISVFFTDSLSLSNETLLAGIVMGYTTSVPVAKMKKLSDLQTSIQAYIDVRYPLNVRNQFVNLYTLAKFDGLTNRAAYIRPGLDWMNSVLAYAANAAIAIQALTTVSDVQNYTINVSANVSSDPMLNVSTAVLITT